MNAFLSGLLGLSLSGTLLALLLMLLRRLAGSRLPNAFYSIAWLLVLLRFVLPLPGLLPGPLPPSPAAGVSAPVSGPAALSVPEAGAVGMRPYTGGADAPLGAYEAPAAGADTAGNAVPVSGPAPVSRFDPAGVLRSPRFWTAVWVAGMAGTAFWYLAGYRRFRRGLEHTLTRPLPSDLAVYGALAGRLCPVLRRSRAVTTPMLLGFARPMIVLPDRDYTPEMLQGVLSHELAHWLRGDVAFKWFSVFVSVIHWFNPVTWLFRGELDRCCELACDEKLLARMDAEEKRLYGDMLLKMAAERRLPRSVVATSFAVEKRNLKERLVQIMTYKKKSRAALCLALAAMLLLSACGAAVGPRTLARSQTLAAAPVQPAQTAAPESPAPTAASEPAVSGDMREVTVDNISDFLHAIASDTVIFLEPGIYDLGAAGDYGQDYAYNPYTWKNTYDGYELVIRDVENLVIAGRPGENGDPVIFTAEPRYAQVMRFENCRGLTLSAFTAGHTQEPGQCAGGVLDLDSCVNTRITGCALYGCGILGIRAVNCDTLFAESCAIYDCSVGAVQARGCRDIRISGCDVYACGGKPGHAGALFDVWTSTGFAVLNSDVRDNDAVYFLRSTSADEVCVLGTQVSGNLFDTLFAYNLISPVVGGSSFADNRHEDMGAYDGRDSVFLPGDGGEIFVTDLEGMTLDRTLEYDGPAERQAAAVTGIPVQDGTEYHVSTVDEFLAAIGSDTTIYLDGEMFDLSTAANYGGYGGEHYYWVDIFDGPGLVITGVKNLRLIGQGKGATTVQAVPRYADVLCFDSCESVTVADLTAGHLKEAPGSCAGDVLSFQKCLDVHVVDCGLFGCGVFGIRADNSIRGDILRTEVYECSEGAAALTRTDGFVFTDCSVHDCVGTDWTTGKPASVNVIVMSDSGDCSYNGMPLHNSANLVGDGELPSPPPAVPAAAQPLVPAPTPAPDLHLFFYETEITKERGGFTMHVGDEPILLTARIEVNGHTAAVPARWSTPDPDCLLVTPIGDGSSCEVEVLRAKKGGTTLTLSADGAVLTMPVYLVD